MTNSFRTALPNSLFQHGANLPLQRSRQCVELRPRMPVQVARCCHYQPLKLADERRAVPVGTKLRASRGRAPHGIGEGQRAEPCLCRETSRGARLLIIVAGPDALRCQPRDDEARERHLTCAADRRAARKRSEMPEPEYRRREGEGRERGRHGRNVAHPTAVSQLACRTSWRTAAATVAALVAVVRSYVCHCSESEIPATPSTCPCLSLTSANRILPPGS